MAGKRAGPPIETWQTLAWQVYDELERVRRVRGKVHAAQLAHQILEKLATPAQPVQEQQTNAKS